MRVLKTEGSDREDWVPRLCTHRSGEPYAILSHRWFEDANHEILFADIQEIDRTVIGTFDDSDVSIVKNAQYAGGVIRSRSKPGFKKVQGAARQALKDGFEYNWIDTCCIDKSSSAELSEAINSMFKWYKDSNVCYAYLVDVVDATDTSDGSPFAESQWWTRGWTLQELLAPYDLAFFTSGWKAIGHKEALGTIIASITGVDAAFLGGDRDLHSYSVAQRMSWASQRATSRPEDIAYCLMGLFDVNMPILYGEGEKAFIRLQQEIIKELDDESIFAWREESSLGLEYTGMLATRPTAFAGSQKVECLYDTDDQRPPYSMTNKGLSISLPPLRFPSSLSGEENIYGAVLKCTTGENRIGIVLKRISSKGLQYARAVPKQWIEDADLRNAEMTSIYVKQSWGGFLGFWGIYQMTLDTNNSTPSNIESQEKSKSSDKMR